MFEVPIIIFALGAMIFWGVGDFLIQRCTRKLGNVETLAFIGIFGSLLLLPLVFNDLHLLFSLNNILLLSGLGIIVFISGIINFEALRKGKISVVDVVIELELPITIALGILFLKETLSFFQASTISLIFIGIILIATKSFTHWKFKLEKGVTLALITVLFMGCINFFTATSAKNISPLLAIWVPWVIIGALSLLFIWKQREMPKFIKNGLRFRKIVFATAIIDTLAWYFYAIAISKSELSIITAITESYPAIAAMLGLWLNKERLRWFQFIGISLALVSSFVLAMTI